jgi:hypothetical protein
LKEVVSIVHETTILPPSPHPAHQQDQDVDKISLPDEVPRENQKGKIRCGAGAACSIIKAGGISAPWNLPSTLMQDLAVHPS